MKGFRDWVFAQLLSKSLASSRQLSGSSFFYQEHADEQLDDQASLAAAVPIPPGTSYNQENQPQPSLQQFPVEDSYQSHNSNNERSVDPLAKIEDLQIKFLRLLRRFGQSHDNLLVAKVLYRMHLATLIRAGESDLKRVSTRSDKGRAIAAEQEAAGLPELNFSIRILVLGKTGVGKSATINSIFDQPKTITSAFQPATDRIQEIVGNVNGIKLTFIDTPGFLPSSTSSMRRNRKIMLAVKRYIKRSPPDIVLFFERLDLINTGYSEFPLLKLITEVFGPAIWFNTILVMTHSSSALPEGLNGHPVSYESYVSHCTDLVQHYIHQAIFDSKLENPVLLVENHPECEKNIKGENILPNGQVWKSQFLLLCICTKVLGDVNWFLEFGGSIELGPLSGTRVPSLPHLLSSFLCHRFSSSPSGMDNEINEIVLSDTEEEDEYDQLPSFRILTKSQFNRLTKSQKGDYLDELDYRETLFLKKQLKEESRRRREKKLSEEENLVNSDEQRTSAEAVMLPEMVVPPSFDSDCPEYRYRCLVMSDQWLMRPVLDPHGWDHDVGFDGVNLETNMEVKKNVFASITGQMRKDKQDFSIQSECAAAYMDPRGPSYSVGFDVQSAGKDLIYTVRSDTRLRSIRHNVTDCGFSLTSFGNKYYVGAKVEDTILIGKRLKFLMNAGRMGGPSQAAYGGGFEVTVRGRDYPVKNNSVSLSVTALSFNKEMVLSGGFQSEFVPLRGTRVLVNANLNSQKMGQVCVKMNSTEHMEIALLAVVSICRALVRGKGTGKSMRETLESG